jgi:hypothetical protein
MSGFGVGPGQDALAVGSLFDASDQADAFLAEDAVEHSDRECEAAHNRTGEIVRQIEGARAHTLEGLMVKVEAVRWCRTSEIVDEDLSEAATDTRILQTILRDLAAIGAGPKSS